MAFRKSQRQIGAVLVVAVVVVLCLNLRSGEAHVHDHESHGHHQCNHGHDHAHAHHHHHEEERLVSNLLPEELAEEEDMKLYGFGFAHDHDHGHDHFAASDLSGFGNQLQFYLYALLFCENVCLVAEKMCVWIVRQFGIVELNLILFALIQG